MKKVVKYSFISLIVCISSCDKGLKPDAYIRFVQNVNNGLKKIIQIDGWEYAIQYKPYDYIFLLENGKNPTKDLRQRTKELKGTAWFNISFKRIDCSTSSLRYGISSLDDYNQRISFFLTNAKDCIHLIYGSDTLSPVNYVFENNYNLTPQETIVVGFQLPRSEDLPRRDMQLVYNDRVFMTGIIKTKYNQEILKSIPSLIY